MPLRQNLVALRTAAPTGAQLCLVVKGNAYGHGLAEVLEAAKDHVDLFQVDDLEELAALRAVCTTPTLVLGYVPSYGLLEALRLGCEICAVDRGHLAEIGAAARTMGVRQRVHLKLDALLGRLGTLPNELDGLFEELDGWPELEPVSIYAHFANIEDTTDLTHAEAQTNLLSAALASKGARRHRLSGHIAATSGLMTMRPEFSQAIIRVGIGAYGMYPSRQLARTHREMELRPVLTWVSHLAQVKQLPAKHPVGYGLTYVTSKPTLIGIVPQGYSDGYPRGLSNSGEVLVAGLRRPVIGRIAMNMFAVDLSEGKAPSRDDEVVLLGGQGDDWIFAEELAGRLGTINYEVTAAISPLLPRRLV